MQEAQQVEVDRQKMRRTAKRVEIVIAERSQRPMKTRKRDTAAVVVNVIE
jgi:hypothetical protein